MLISFATILTGLAIINSQWATPANTLLLVVLVFVTNKWKKEDKHERIITRRTVTRKIDEVHADVSSAAAAALSAAEAAAQAAVISSDTARIAKDIGARARHRD